MIKKKIEKMLFKRLNQFASIFYSRNYFEADSNLIVVTRSYMCDQKHQISSFYNYLPRKSCENH